jgi:DNA-binding MarR family transcriptional regulator
MMTIDARRALRAYLRAVIFAEPIQQALSQKYGITLADLRSLRILRDLGRAPISRFAEEVGIGRSTATGLVDRLEDRELVVRGPSSTDRRVVLIEITPRGRAALEDRALVEDNIIGEQIAALSAAQQRQFADLVGALTGQPVPDEAEAPSREPALSR